MKTIKLILGVLVLTSQIINARELPQEKSEEADAITVQRKLATLDKGKNSIKNAKKIIRLLQFHLHRHDIKSVEQGIPAAGYILRSYDKDLVPLLVDYALNIEDEFLKRRAVYCVEKLHGNSIQDYIQTVFGEVVRSEKFETLVRASKHDMLVKAQVLKKAGKYGEYALLVTEHVEFFYPQMSDSLLNLKILGE